LLYRPVA